MNDHRKATGDSGGTPKLPAPMYGASAPERPEPRRERHHVAPYTAPQYAYLPRSASRTVPGVRV